MQNRLRIRPLLAGVLLSLPGALCTPGCTTDQAARPAARAGALPEALFIAQVDGRDYYQTDMLDFPELRKDLIQVRDFASLKQMVDLEFATTGMEVDQDYLNYKFEAIYRNFNDPANPTKPGKQVFYDQFKIGTDIPVAAFEADVARGIKMEMLINREHPMDESLVRTQFESMTPAEQLQNFGPQVGWAAVEDVNYEDVRWLLREMQASQMLVPYTQEFSANLRQRFIAEGQLVVHWFPGEKHLTGNPEADTALAAPEAEGQIPEELEHAARSFGADRTGRREELHGGADHTGADAARLAYTLGGTPVTWAELFLDPINARNALASVNRMTELVAVEAYAVEHKVAVDPAALRLDYDNNVRNFGGETQLQDYWQATGITEQEFRDSLRREALIRQIVIQEYPVTEAQIRERYDQQEQDMWFRAFKDQLGLRSPADATYARMRPVIQLELEANQGTQYRLAVMNTIKNTLRDTGIMRTALGGGETAKGLSVPAMGLPQIPPVTETVAQRLGLPIVGAKSPPPTVEATPDEHAGHNH